jgi:hypothetical protein
MSNATVDNAATALLLQVDNYNNAQASGEQRGTYLRLGAVPSGVVSAYDSLNNASVTNSDAALTNATGEDLARQVMGFVDDDRYRGKDGSDFLTLSTTGRQDESKHLHTRGGWRDHTDGNRVTTTRGDKVEVIGGNYKLLVLGREQWNNDAGGNDYGAGLHQESSGGITYYYDEVPGQIIDVRRTTDGSTWQVMEECEAGHFVARYHGVDKDWHAGGDLVTRIGSRGAYKSSKGADWSTVNSDLGFNDDSDADFTKPANAAHLSGVFWPGDNALPEVREEIFADKVTERVNATDGNIEDSDGTTDDPADSFTEETYAKDIFDWQTFSFYRQYMRGPDLTCKAEEHWEGLFFEMFVAIATTIKLGFFWDLRLGYTAVMINAAKAINQLNATVKRTGLTVAPFFIDINSAPMGATFRTVFSSYELLGGVNNTTEAVHKVTALRISKN